MHRPYRVLVIDDQATLAQNIVRYIANRGYDVRSATSGGCGLAIAEEFRPELAIVDYRLPGLNGLETVAALRSICPGLRAIMITAYGDPGLKKQALRRGVWAYLTKPIVLSELKALLDRAACDVDGVMATACQTQPDAHRTTAPTFVPKGGSSRGEGMARRAFLTVGASLATLVIGAGGGYTARRRYREGRADDLQVAGKESAEAHLVDEIANYYLVFVGDERRPYELGAARKSYIEEWFSARQGRPIRVPDLSRHGITFAGARLMAVEGRSAGPVLYTLPTGGPMGLCITNWEGAGLTVRDTQTKGLQTVHWADARSIFVLMCRAGTGAMLDLVPDVEHAIGSA